MFVRLSVLSLSVALVTLRQPTAMSATAAVATPKTAAVHCDYICDPCGANKTVAFAFQQNSDVDDPFSCSTGGCISGDCFVAFNGADPATAVVAAIQSDASLQEVARVVRKYSSYVRYNLKRSAFQILGCNGDVIANIPVDPISLVQIAHAAVTQG